jgi:hypothetical protein
METGWEIVHEHRFDKELTSLKRSCQRGDDCIAGITWVLSRNPEMGFEYRDGLRCLGFCDPEAENVKLAYTFSPEKREIYLLSIFRDTGK